MLIASYCIIPPVAGASRPPNHSQLGSVLCVVDLWNLPMDGLSRGTVVCVWRKQMILLISNIKY